MQKKLRKSWKINKDEYEIKGYISLKRVYKYKYNYNYKSTLIL